MRISVSLWNSSECLLDRKVFEVPSDTDALDGDAVDDAVSYALDGWTFSVGDTIKIRIAGAAGE